MNKSFDEKVFAPVLVDFKEIEEMMYTVESIVFQYEAILSILEENGVSRMGSGMGEWGIAENAMHSMRHNIGHLEQFVFRNIHK